MITAVLVLPWEGCAERRRLVEAFTTTILASILVTWRGAPLIQSRQLLADTQHALEEPSSRCGSIRA